MICLHQILQYFNNCEILHQLYIKLHLKIRCCNDVTDAPVETWSFRYIVSQKMSLQFHLVQGKWGDRPMIGSPSQMTFSKPPFPLRNFYLQVLTVRRTNWFFQGNLLVWRSIRNGICSHADYTENYSFRIFIII